MAKATKKANAKKATNAKKNKFTIDLGNLALTDKERQKILDAAHKAVSSEVKADGKTSVQRGAAGEPALTRGATGTTAGTATITATFRNADTGVSELTATHNDEEKTIRQSGTIELAGVKKGEVIMVQGKSLGKAELSIDREASPQSIKFEPGIIAFNFFILS